MSELVYELDLKSSAFRHVGSNPTRATIFSKRVIFKMTGSDIRLIEKRLETSDKWNVLVLQNDIKKLLNEIKMLKKKNKNLKKKRKKNLNDL